MGATVVYVHGNGNKVREELLKSQWDRALFGTDMGSASRMAYWAPVRYPDPLPDRQDDRTEDDPTEDDPTEDDPTEDGPGGIEELPGPGAQAPPEEFVAQVLAEARREAAASAGTEKGAARDPAAEERLAGWLRDMAWFADTLVGDDLSAGSGASDTPRVLPLPGFARKQAFRLLVERTYKDVHAYFFGGAGPAMREVVRAALPASGNGPLVVVAHSLGSIVAYEVLREEQRPVDLLVTVGCPLAIREVQDVLALPPAVPGGTSVWHNASDLRDLVALDHTLRPEYAPVDLVTDHLVTNSSANHHGIREYLAAGPVRDPVRALFGRLATEQTR
ncbi:hypothetical protein [Streptomyces sp. NPDC051183]|uniref:hypothetical protein n=1 Tax=Streptomyces sp. NPDC051183 TaxID=3155165 RepID=UPI0034309425